jgi:hypothetical protein
MGCEYKQIELPRGETSRKMGMGVKISKGMGSSNDTVRRFVGNLKTQLSYPNYHVPIIEQCRIHYPGPLSDANVLGSFGTFIDPLSASASSPPAGAVSVESTMVDPGKVQQYTIVIGVGFIFEPEPLQFSARGNAVTAPATSISKPISPDAFNIEDQNIGSGATAYSSLGLLGTQNFSPAVLEWGTWQNYAAFYMSVAYNLEWVVAHNMSIINDPLRYTMHIPSRAQEGSSSNSEVVLATYIRRVNDYYRASLNSAYTFLSIDRTRVGYTGATAGANVGAFRPTSAYNTVAANFGGLGCTSHLSRNPEFRRLVTPYVLRPGVPIGLRARVMNTNDQQLMQQQLMASAGYNSGLIPAVITDDVNISPGTFNTGAATGTQAGTATQTGVELSLDASPAVITKSTPSARQLFRGGPFKISVALRGWEVDEDTARALQDPDIASLIQQSCGLNVAAAG